MEDVTRRRFLGATAAGMTALAGCSNSGNDSDTPDRSTPSRDTETSDSDPDSTETNTDTEDRGQVSGKLEDTVHEGEEELEQFISSKSEYDDEEPDYLWIEFENPSEQISLPIESEGFSGDEQLAYFIENGEFTESQQGETYAIDSMYLAMPETGENATELYLLNEERWEEDSELMRNILRVYDRGIQGSSGGRAEISEQDWESLFSEDVQAYNDVSEDFPQEYLDLVEE